MKNLIILLFPIWFISCSQPVIDDIRGAWIIVEITHEGDGIYPNTICDKPFISVDYTDGQFPEKIVFEEKSGMVEIPGFNTCKTKYSFNFNYDTVSITPIQMLNGTIIPNELATDIFMQKFIITANPKLWQKYKGITLTSEHTQIVLINEVSYIDCKTDAIFNQIK